MECEKRNEKAHVTGYVLPFCTVNMLHKNNNGKPGKQYWAICKTCCMSVCIACASTCHDGHEVALAISVPGASCYGRSQCRCGELKCCKSTAQIQEELAVGKQLSDLVISQLVTHDELMETETLIQHLPAEQNKMHKNWKEAQQQKDACAARLSDLLLKLAASDEERSLAFMHLAGVRGTDTETRAIAICNTATEMGTRLQKERAVLLQEIATHADHMTALRKQFEASKQVFTKRDQLEKRRVDLWQQIFDMFEVIPVSNAQVPPQEKTASQGEK
jgi:hypothetical protein